MPGVIGRILLFGILMVVLTSVMGFRAQPVDAGSHPPLQNSVSFGEYAVKTYFDPSSDQKDAYFEIFKNNKVIYRKQATETGERFVVGTLYDDDPDAKLVAMGNDITGDGKPDLLVSEWTGGANCCLTLHVFEIGSQFRKIASLDAAFGDQGPHFVHLAQGPGLQVQLHDWTFANWHTDFADSPAPKVILRYQNESYQVAPDLMRTATVDMKDLAAKADSVKTDAKHLHGGSWPDVNLPPKLWGTMLDLIYSGHRDLASQFLDMVWPKQIGGKADFRREFDEQLKRSPYWKSLAQPGI
jgi:hypothetical protein